MRCSWATVATPRSVGREETSTRLQNGDTQFGDLRCRQGGMSAGGRGGIASVREGSRMYLEVMASLSDLGH
jgi:hypothetical protein